MARSYIIEARCTLATPATFSEVHMLKEGLMSNYYINGEYLMCKVIAPSPILAPGASGVITISLIVLNSKYLPKVGDIFELREGRNLLATCECISSVSEA